MRQIGESELVWRVRYELSRLRPSMRDDLKSPQTEIRKCAESMVADKIVQRLRGLEILSSAPLPEGSDLFHAPPMARRINR